MCIALTMMPIRVSAYFGGRSLQVRVGSTSAPIPASYLWRWAGTGWDFGGHPESSAITIADITVDDHGNPKSGAPEWISDWARGATLVVIEVGAI